MLALRKRAELDSKYVVILKPDEPSELKQSLRRLGSALAELANIYYRDEGKRVKLRIEKKTSSSSSIELHIRYCFKVRAPLGPCTQILAAFCMRLDNVCCCELLGCCVCRVSKRLG